MKVAIIGGGLAGLTCAHELEKHNIIPTIYDINNHIGDVDDHMAAVLGIADKNLSDGLNYLNKTFGISLTPLNTVNKLTHYSQKKKSILEGNFGYLFKRNKDMDSLKLQLYSKLKKSRVVLNHFADYKELAPKYDYVVIANGNPFFTKELGCWQAWVKGYIKTCTVVGNFNPNEIIMWVDKKYAEGGYAYLTPYSDKRACISLFVTRSNVRTINSYWEVFLRSENINFQIREEYMRLHESGYVYPLKVGNIYFAGNAGGVLDPFIGFGQVNSMLSGALTAQSILTGKDIYKLNSIIREKVLPLYDFRTEFDKLSNEGLDRLIASIKLPGVKQIAYDSPFNIVKYGSLGVKFKHLFIKDEW